MSMKEWIDLDIENLELLEVTEIEKASVKQHVLKKRRKTPFLRNIAIASLVFLGATITTGFAFPSLASQIPFMNHVIHYFEDDEDRYNQFEAFSTDVDLVQTSNGITVMIDNAVYDGTNVTVTYAIETEHPFGENLDTLAPHWFEVEGAVGSGGTGNITKISETRYVGIATFTPHFKDINPEIVNVTWEPTTFTNHKGIEIKGDWSFAFTLKSLEGELQLVNKTVQEKDISFTLQSIEFTPVSTVISYEQVVTDELLKVWSSVTPSFKISDDLGTVYIDGTGGGGMSPDNGKTLNGTTEFGSIKDNARQLIIQPIAIASMDYGKGNVKIELDPLVIDLKK